MTLRLYDTDIPSLVLERTYPEPLKQSEGGLQEHSIHLDNFIGKGSYHEIYFEGVHIGFGDARLSNKLLIHFETDFETVEMHFALKGSSTAISAELPSQLSFNAHQHNIIYANNMRGKMHWDSEIFQLFEINLSPAFFKKFLPEDTDLFDRFRTIIDRGLCGSIDQQNRLISQEMYQIIEEIMHCQRKGLFKRMFLEAKVIELLLLQLEQITEGVYANTALSKENIDKIYAVRDFILDNIDTTTSLLELAHHVGTNEFTLKKGFKELFGTTVFGFWSDAKMEQAKIMLREQGGNITEVSQFLGYKNPRHFSTAFKRKCGILPSQWKNTP